MKEKISLESYLKTKNSITFKHLPEEGKYRVYFQRDFDAYDTFEIWDEGTLYKSIKCASTQLEPIYLLHTGHKLETQEKVLGITIMKLDEIQRHLSSLKHLVEEAKNPPGIYADYEVIFD